MRLVHVAAVLMLAGLGALWWQLGTGGSAGAKPTPAARPASDPTDDDDPMPTLDEAAAARRPAPPRPAFVPAASAYELGSAPGGVAVVNLAGGAPEMTSSGSRPPARRRVVDGYVRRSDGGPAAGAVVLGGTRVGVAFAHLTADVGAVTDAAGHFRLAGISADAVSVLAVTPQAWSTPSAVPAGSDASVELTLPAACAVAGAVTLAGRPAPATLNVVAGQFSATLATDEQGRYRFAPAPCGPARVAVALGGPVGEVGTQESRTVELAGGHVVTADFDFALGLTLIVKPRFAEGLMPTFVDYLLLPDQVPPTGFSEALLACSPGGPCSRYGVGGQDAAAEVRFKHLGPGARVVCVEGRAGDVRHDGCARAVLEAGREVVTLDLPTTPSDPPPAGVTPPPR